MNAFHEGKDWLLALRRLVIKCGTNLGLEQILGTVKDDCTTQARGKCDWVSCFAIVCSENACTNQSGTRGCALRSCSESACTSDSDGKGCGGSVCSENSCTENACNDKACISSSGGVCGSKVCDSDICSDLGYGD